MNTPKANNSELDPQKVRMLRRRVGILLVLPWPLLYFGYWSLYHVKGPASDGFGTGTYAAAIFAAAYGLTLYLLNRAVVYSRHIPKVRSSDRALYAVTLILFIAGVLGLLPTLFFLMLGFPFSLVGIILALLGLFRWSITADESRRIGGGA